MKTFDIGIYERISGPGPQFMARPLVNEKERLIFTGSTAEGVEARARDWYRKNIEPDAALKEKTPKAKPAADDFEDLLG